MSVMPSRNRTAGFTLFELLMVMLVIAIMMGIGIPSFKYVSVSNRIASEMNLLVGDLQYARAEAIKEGNFVTVCASSDGATCSGSNTWQTGWIVFADAAGNKAFDIGNDTLLRKRPAFSANNSTDTLVSTSAAMTAIMFNREGYASTGAATVQNLQLHSTPTTNNWTRCLQVTPIGGLTVELYGNGTPTCS
ncbi:MAG TPA: Tfp pilus assembly protein FimT/FimU [Steroidobacteraceae bacterium]|jgi:type IV fimbrial biogenesis protein FimT|nr:Tfp pilus assembly protein FimT/FimU [Steroidobacteraceae bacterium]